MRLWSVAAILTCFVAGACNRESQPTVVIDNWWAVDFAKNSCRAANACGFDKGNPGNVQDYINSLKAQFAATSACRGVTVIDYRGPSFKNPDQPKEHESLIIDYVPNEAVQHFAIMGQPSTNLFGTGSIQQIVERTCVAARGLGARVE